MTTKLLSGIVYNATQIGKFKDLIFYVVEPKDSEHGYSNSLNRAVYHFNGTLRMGCSGTRDTCSATLQNECAKNTVCKIYEMLYSVYEDNKENTQ